MQAIRLGPQYLQRYRDLMLEGYATHPDAFTSSVAERASLPMSFWEGRLTDDPNPLVVAYGVEVGDTLAGAVGLGFETREKTRHKANLVGLFVRTRFRGLGVGAALVDAVLAGARARAGVVLVQLNVSNHNDAAKRLYARHGFIEYGVEPYAMTHEGSYLDKCLMWCDLAGLRSCGSPA